MTQIAARVALVSFLDAARRDGCRCVLVVTGKGAQAPERDYAPESTPRGIIRRRFQEWLDEEPLRAMIARAAPAAPRDGGAGAFYVFLKSKGARL
jgi:DNA-nicking Smr family endonuclease